jgi:hypothetical protein
MMEFIFLALGILVGMNLRAEWMNHQYTKTVDQLDQEMRNELQLYKNLSESLKQDLLWEKSKQRRSEDGKKKES